MRYKDRQEEAANFRDTKLTKPDSRSAEATQQGVVNTHAYGELQGDSYAAIGKGVAAGIGHAKEFKDGYTLAKIRQKRNANIDDYLNPDQSLVNAEILALEVERESLADAEQAVNRSGDIDLNPEEHIFGVPEGKTEELNKTVGMAQANVRTQIGKLNKARDQGRIDSKTFLSRSRQLVREAIAANPTLEDEIIADTRRLWEIAGVQDRISLDNTEAAARRSAEEKTHAFRLKAWGDMGKTVTPKLFDGSDDTDKMDAELFEFQKIEVATKLQESLNAGTQAQRIAKVDRILKKDENGVSHADRLSAGIWTKLVSGTIAKLPDAALMKGGIGKFKELYDIEIRNTITAFQNEYNEYNDPRIVRLVTNFEAIGKAFSDILDDQLTQETATKYIKNLDEVGKIKALNDLAARLKMDAPTQAFMLKAAVALKGLNALENDPNALTDLVATVRIMMTAAKDTREATVTSDPEGHKDVSKNVPVLLDEAGRENPDPLAAPAANNVQQAGVLVINLEKDPEKQMIKIEEEIVQMADPRYRQSSEIFSQETRKKVNQVTSAGIRVYGKHLTNDLKMLSDRGVGVEVTYKNGILTFDESNNSSGRNQTDIEALTKTYSGRVTTARSAIANINGWKVDDAKVDEIIREAMPSLQEDTNEKKKRFL